MATYSVFREKLESGVERCQSLQPGGTKYETPTLGIPGFSFLFKHILRSHFNRRDVDTLDVFQFFGYSFVGCGSHDFNIWQDFSPMSPLPSYTYSRPKFKQKTLVF